MSATLTEIIDGISKIGFPAAVALWLMLRTDKLLIGLTQAITNLALVVEHCKRKDE